MQAKPKEGATADRKPSEKQSGGGGSPIGAGNAGQQQGSQESPESNQIPADQANLDYTRKQTELALEHLRDQLAKEKSDLLNNRLHWTRDEAERFLKRWEQLQQAAAKQDSAGAVRQKVGQRPTEPPADSARHSDRPRRHDRRPRAKPSQCRPLRSAP